MPAIVALVIEIVKSNTRTRPLVTITASDPAKPLAGEEALRNESSGKEERKDSAEIREPLSAKGRSGTCQAACIVRWRLCNGSMGSNGVIGPDCATDGRYRSDGDPVD